MLGSARDPSVKNYLTDILSEFSSFENQHQVLTRSGKDYEKTKKKIIERIQQHSFH